MEDGSCNDCAAFAQEIQAIANKHLKSISKHTRCRCFKNRVILKRPKYTQMIIWHFECHQCDYSSFYASEIENHVDSEHPSFAEEPQSLPLHATVPLDSATSDSKESLLTESPSLTLSIAHLDSPEKTVDSRTPSPHSQAVQNTVILSSSKDSSLDVSPSAHSALVTQPAHSALVTSSAHSTLVTSSAHSTLVTSSAHSTLVTSSAHSTMVTSSATSAVVSSATSATESPTVVSSATPLGGTICELSQTTSSPMMPPPTSSSDSVCSPVTPPSISSVANTLKKPVIVNVISSPKTEATASMITTTAAATKELPTTRTAADASLSETSVITTTGSVTITAPQAKAAVVNSTPQPAMLYVVDETAKTVGYPVNCPMANSEASHAQNRSKPKLLPHKQTKTKSKQIAKPATARNDVTSESLPPSAQVLKQSSTSTSSYIKKKAQTELSIACRPPATITPGDGSSLNSSPANTDTIKPSVLSPPGPEAKSLKSPTLNLNDFTHILGLRQLAPKDPISKPSVESPVIKNSMEGSQFSSRRV
ncbi:hypothetical protein EB796_018927 [Bugula neritina]|uniref:Uncharacterized protein n=1 Tax=Bugula neritina TaxID=10212 RepID=A0A7J7JAS0_BUGNE|nr:hypothetical protein EB796_018927 [Bugula neritina]